jgi:ribosome-binding factor A
MEHRRSDRIGDLLLEVIAEVLREEIRDPRVAAVTLTAAKVTKDLRQARIYFNVLGGAADKQPVLTGLRSASGFIRTRIAKQLKLRYVPTLDFLYDHSTEEAQRIDDLLRDVKR